jgi:hypothetical protein
VGQFRFLGLRRTHDSMVSIVRATSTERSDGQGANESRAFSGGMHPSREPERPGRCVEHEDACTSGSEAFVATTVYAPRRADDRG